MPQHLASGCATSRRNGSKEELAAQPDPDTPPRHFAISVSAWPCSNGNPHRCYCQEEAPKTTALAIARGSVDDGARPIGRRRRGALARPIASRHVAVERCGRRDDEGVASGEVLRKRVLRRRRGKHKYRQNQFMVISFMRTDHVGCSSWWGVGSIALLPEFYSRHR